MTTSKSVKAEFELRSLPRQMRTSTKNLQSTKASLQICESEDEHVWRLGGQRGHKILEAKVYNLKIKRRCSKTFRGYSSNNQIAKMQR